LWKTVRVALPWDGHLRAGRDRELGVRAHWDHEIVRSCVAQRGRIAGGAVEGEGQITREKVGDHCVGGICTRAGTRRVGAVVPNGDQTSETDRQSGTGPPHEHA
jgi:hypothetical protein